MFFSGERGLPGFGNVQIGFNPDIAQNKKAIYIGGDTLERNKLFENVNPKMPLRFIYK